MVGVSEAMTAYGEKHRVDNRTAAYMLALDRCGVGDAAARTLRLSSGFEKAKPFCWLARSGVGFERTLAESCRSGCLVEYAGAFDRAAFVFLTELQGARCFGRLDACRDWRFGSFCGVSDLGSAGDSACRRRISASERRMIRGIGSGRGLPRFGCAQVVVEHGVAGGFLRKRGFDFCAAAGDARRRGLLLLANICWIGPFGRKVVPKGGGDSFVFFPFRAADAVLVEKRPKRGRFGRSVAAFGGAGAG